MTSLFRELFTPQRVGTSVSFDQIAEQFKYLSTWYPLALKQTLTGDKEEVDESFEGYVQSLYKANGVVFACMGARLRLFSEARFQFRSLSSRPVSGRRDSTLAALDERGITWTERRPGRLFGTPDLAILENPWPNGNTKDLLARAIQDADLAGNSFFARRDRRGKPALKRLRPDWTAIVLGDPDGTPAEVAGDIDAEVIGYIYQPGGYGSGQKPIPLLVEEVSHFAPYPDPGAAYRGMSWLTPVVNEILGDKAATTHKLKFFENGATANAVVTLDPSITPDDFNRWVDLFDQQHTGYLNAYKTLYFGGGADMKVVGADMHQMDFKTVQGAGETRIAAAAGVPPVIVGLSEGLQAATYSNYGQARRSMADLMARPAWGNACGSFTKLVNVPPGAELWYDESGIAFLREDQKDAAEIQGRRAQTIRQLVDAGFEPESVKAAVEADDFMLLSHTGLYSVQLQPPGTSASADQAGRSIAEWVQQYLKKDN